MNWMTLILDLIPVFIKYGPGAINGFKANQPELSQFITDIKPALVSPNPLNVIPLFIKYAPVITDLIKTDGATVQAFIADVEKSWADANKTVLTAPIVVKTTTTTPAMPVTPATSTNSGLTL